MGVSGINPHNKEIAIRRRINSIFNKREEDFSSLKDYNDYLEEVEDMAMNLIEGVDVATIEAKIAQYEKENAEQIMINRAKKAEEFAAAMAAYKAQPQQANNDVATTENSEDAMASGAQGHYAPTFGGAQPRPTGMAPQPLPLGGGIHGYDDEEMMRLRAEKGGRAGGWTPEISKKRALEEAFGSLWI